MKSYQLVICGGGSTYTFCPPFAEEISYMPFFTPSETPQDIELFSTICYNIFHSSKGNRTGFPLYFIIFIISFFSIYSQDVCTVMTRFQRFS